MWYGLIGSLLMITGWIVILTDPISEWYGVAMIWSALPFWVIGMVIGLYIEMLRAERREQKKKNSRKMKVHGKSVKLLNKIILEKEETLRGEE